MKIAIILVIISAFLSIIGVIIDKIVNKRWKKWLVWLTILLIILSATFKIIDIRVKENQERYCGRLKNSSKILLSGKDGIFPKLKLGNSKTFFVWQGPSGEAMLKFLGINDLIIEAENGKLKISTKIRDKNGQIITEIANNEWKLKKEILWDRNYNDTALEVKNTEGDVVLQVILKKDCIQFSAKMYDGQGNGIGLGSKLDERYGEILGVLEIRKLWCPLELHIDPIFEYPSDLHLGQLLIKQK
jgi:hypothetical protein